MKVGTDAVLLGAWMPVPFNCQSILEIGSGCGVISLMLAQRTGATITGIDIDKNSVNEAQKNAENSIWNKRISFFQENVQDFSQKTKKKFDTIVSNPPFFQNCLKSPKTSRNISKHNDNLPLETLASTVEKLLADEGRFGVILPAETAEKFEISALKKCLYATKKTQIYPTRTKKCNRILLMFEREPKPCDEQRLLIRENGYTDEYKQLVGEYLLI